MKALDRSALGALEKLAAGSQGTVYLTKRLRLDGRMRCVYKEYFPQFARQVVTLHLEEMTSFLYGLRKKQGEQLLNICAWPVATVRSGSATVGFLMPYVPDEFGLTLTLPSGRRKVTVGQFQHLLNSDAHSRAMGVVADDPMRLRLIGSVAENLAVLHAHSIAVGDLSPKNLLFSLGHTPKAYFVDCDAMTLSGKTVLPQLETSGWCISDLASGESRGTTSADVYKFGLLVIRTVARHQTSTSLADMPYWAQNRLSGLLEITLSRHPEERPPIKIWVDYLRSLVSQNAAG